MFQLPGNVKKIIALFNEAGYEAYAVGGCVRDTLLGKEPQDWDITTSATPEEMKQIFTKTIDTGIQHGTVTVRMGGESYEVTTYRIDGEYEDGRHPKQVQFTSNLREDLRRRDFTINAMAYSDGSGLVDMFEGEKDLAQRRIRAVGNPVERFSEDALRMLRAVRFAAQLGFSIDKETKDGIALLAENLKQVSMERIHTELVKLLVSNHPEEIYTCYETGLLDWFFPELGEAIAREGEAATKALLNNLRFCRADKDLRFCLLFDFCNWREKNISEMSSDMATKVLRRLKLDGNTIRRTSHLLKFLRIEAGESEEVTPAEIRKYFSMVSMEHAEDIVYLKKVIYNQTELYLEKELEAIQTYGYCTAIKELAVTGEDLLALGVEQGKGLGEYLKAALAYVLEQPDKNTKESLVQFVQEKQKKDFRE